MGKRLLKIFCFLIFFSSTPLIAEDSPLWKKAKIIKNLISAQPIIQKKDFAPQFLEKVPPFTLANICRFLYGKYGKIQKILLLSKSGTRGIFEFYFEKKWKMKVYLVLQNQRDFPIIGLRFGPPQPAKDTLKKVLQDIQSLPGQSSLAVVQLTPSGKSLSLLKWNSKQQMAIGSAFKLYVLGALLKEIRKRNLSWEDICWLKKTLYSHPSGILHKWPGKGPVTLFTLASLMISQSDNTATDHLIQFLGRRAVEKQLKRMGHSQPSLNMPFLTTLEMFKMKFYSHAGERALLFNHLDREGKEIYLDRILSSIPREKINLAQNFFPLSKDLQKLEWFASTQDLCQAMLWIWKESKTPKMALARKILAINPGLNLSKEKWIYIGYKGGGDLGVLNMTYLLQRKDGAWFILSFTWNNDKRELSIYEGTGLVSRLIQQLEQLSIGSGFSPK